MFVDIVTNRPLTETNAMEEIYNDCMTSLKGKLEGQRPERSKPLLTGASEVQQLSVFIGENMNPGSTAAVLDSNENA